jgi:hypothetical protein
VRQNARNGRGESQVQTAGMAGIAGAAKVRRA